MTQVPWLIEDVNPLDVVATQELEHHLPAIHRKGLVRGEKVSPIAIRLHDIIIHDNKKWFGEADIRLDALVVHGQGKKSKPESFYMPRTFCFYRVDDGDRLPIDETGLLIFYGKPLYFLDVFIMVSRDREKSSDLSTLLSEQLQSDEVQAAIGTLISLAVSMPQLAVVTAALGAASILGNFALQVLRKATGGTIGLYRASWLQHRDNFGIGRHPSSDVWRVKDLSFWYEIIP